MPEPVTCDRHGGPMADCATSKHEHGDRGSDRRIWLRQYGVWGFGGDTNRMVDAVIAYFEDQVRPSVEHLSAKSHEWLTTVLISEHQKNAAAAAWVLAWYDEHAAGEVAADA